MQTQTENTWISEDEAAFIMELPGPFFRGLVLEGSLKGVVQYWNHPETSYKYNKVDIENYIFEDSFFASL